MKSSWLQRKVCWVKPCLFSYAIEVGLPTLISKLIYDEYRDVFLREIFLPVRKSKDGMQDLPRDFVIMVLNKNLKKKYEVFFNSKNYTGSIHVTEKGVYLLRKDEDENNKYYKADRFIFD